MAIATENCYTCKGWQQHTPCSLLGSCSQQSNIIIITTAIYHCDKYERKVNEKSANPAARASRLPDGKK